MGKTEEKNIKDLKKEETGSAIAKHERFSETYNPEGLTAARGKPKK